MYEFLPFPLRDPADEKRRMMTPVPDLLSRINHNCFYGRNDFGDGFRALVAGGGTGDTTIFLADQLAKRGGGHVVHLDQTEASIEVARQRAEQRGLSNITWLHRSILDLAEMEIEPFDYINCAGVLHHMPEPVQGLRALEAVLKPDGAICLMLYAKTGRSGVTTIRNALQVATRGETGQIPVVEVQNLLEKLPEFHSWKRGRTAATDVRTIRTDPNNVADTFLNPIEYTYSINEMADFVESVGDLIIQEWASFRGVPATFRGQYNPIFLLAGTGIDRRAQNLSQKEKYEIVENLDHSISLHTAYIRRRHEKKPLSLQDGVPYFPGRFEERVIKTLCALENGIVLRLANGMGIRISASPNTKRFLASVDDERTSHEIFTSLNFNRDELVAITSELSIMVLLDWINVRHKDVHAFYKPSDVTGDMFQFKKIDGEAVILNVLPEYEINS